MYNAAADSSRQVRTAAAPLLIIRQFVCLAGDKEGGGWRAGVHVSTACLRAMASRQGPRVRHSSLPRSSEPRSWNKVKRATEHEDFTGRLPFVASGFNILRGALQRLNEPARDRQPTVAPSFRIGFGCFPLWTADASSYMRPRSVRGTVTNCGGRGATRQNGPATSGGCDGSIAWIRSLGILE